MEPTDEFQGADVGPGPAATSTTADQGQTHSAVWSKGLLPGDEVVLQPTATEVEDAFLLLHDGVQVGNARN